MELERYDFEVDGSQYVFYSVGPKGRIRKVVKYTAVGPGDLRLYNLVFGDWCPGTGRIDDKVVTDNKDMQKVLATVAAAVIDFMDKNPNASLFARGSTASRTRLYQMSINRYFYLIAVNFEVEGFIRQSWQPFECGCSYTAFLLTRKKNIHL